MTDPTPNPTPSPTSTPSQAPNPTPNPTPSPTPNLTPGLPAPDTQPVDRRAVVLGGIALAVFAAIAIGLLALVAGSGIGTGSGTSASTAPGASAYAYADPVPAPPLELTDQDGQPFRLADLAGRPVLVFFGYTHCPDVCPTTVGNVNQVLTAVGPGPRVVFVSIDPERDDVAAMANYMRFLPDAYYGLSGTPDEVSRNAAGWGVKYARIDQQSDGGYAMAHTADLFLVDAQGRLRAKFPFGTPAEPITGAVQALLAQTPPPTEPPVTQAPGPGSTPTPVPTRAPTPGPTAIAGAPTAPAADDLRLTVVSTSIWAEPSTPIIVNVGDDQGGLLDGSVPVSFQVTGAGNAPTGPPVPATAVLPMGERMTYFVANVPIPQAGSWRLNVTTADGHSGSTPIVALDPGGTAPVGSVAPDVDTPTLADVGGNIKQLTTVVDAQVDERFYSTSIADARKAGRPYVLVIDSNRFRVSPACGRAITMVRYLLDRWPDVTFAHLEPFEYQVVTEEPVLSGSIDNPPLNSWTRPWGIGDEVWPATAMPWIFVVDGDGVVRAKYTGVVGSADIDVIVSLLTGKGVVTP